MSAIGDVTTGDMDIRCRMRTILQHLTPLCLPQRTPTRRQVIIRHRSEITPALQPREETTPTLLTRATPTLSPLTTVMPTLRPRKVTNRTVWNWD